MINRLKKLSPQFEKVLKLTSTLSRDLDYKVYLVGGVVRDLLLAKEVFDLDIVVEGNAIKLASGLSRRLKADFRKHHLFGTATVNWQGHKIDFVTARSESYSHWGALPRVKPASLAEDLERRDFTINTIAIGLNKGDYGKLIDLYGGLKDLKKGIIRVLHQQSFLEDPTRIFRAIRFEQRFKFKIQTHSLGLLNQAIKKNALSWVSPHRLRNELIIILKEARPRLCITRINNLNNFSFIIKGLRINEKRFKLFRQIEKVLIHYQQRFKSQHQPQAWTIYLGGIFIGLSLGKVNSVLHDFGFKKGERAIVTSMKAGLSKVRRLDSKASPRLIQQILDQYSLEAILFFYAYYSRPRLRKNIEYFLTELIHSRIKLRGRDLKELGFQPQFLYGKILKQLSHLKLSKGLKTKGDEIREAGRIFKRLQKE